MNCSIDKLTVLGFLASSQQFRRYITSVDTDYVKSFKTDTETYPYQDKWWLTDGSFLSYAGDTAARVPEIRIEFNPNKCDIANMLALMSHVTMRRATRVDVAMDFDIDLSRYLWLCPGKTSRRYYDRSGRLETLYFGKRGSEREYRLYDKAKEQEVKDRVWWRAECQIRFRPGDKEYLPEEAFNGLFAVIPEQKDLGDRALVDWLKRYPEQMAELSRRQRTRLAELSTSVDEIFRLSDTYRAGRDHLRKILNLWLPEYH